MFKFLVIIVFQTAILTVLIGSLSACAILWPTQQMAPSPALPESQPSLQVLIPSSAPLTDLTKDQIVYAQNTLNKLGFELGLADGIWGPRSVRAILKFEQANNIESAHGHLSELNVQTLEKFTTLTRESEAKRVTQSEYPFSARVDTGVPLKGAPQLVIIERTRALFAKPNPYSEVISRLVSGTGIYVIDLQEGWYEVESEGRVKGFISAN